MSSKKRRTRRESQGSEGKPVRPQSGSDWRFFSAAGGIVLVALLLRIYRIGSQEAWLDETFSFHLATTPNLLDGLLIENSPPLYYLLLRAWLVVAGQSEAALRLLSAVAGTLCVAAVIWAGREVFNAGVGLWSGAVAALSPIHIYYSQEARAYALLTMLLALTTAVLCRAMIVNAWRWWALLSVCALLALYTHYFAVFGLLSTVALPFLWRATSRWVRYVTAMLISGLLFLPWVVWSFVLTPRSLAPFSWIRNVWEQTPPLLAIPLTLEVFGLGSQGGLLPSSFFLKQFTRMEFPAPLRLLALAMLVFLGIWVALPWAERHLDIPWLGRRKALLGVLLLLPLTGLWGISLYQPVYVVGRYDIVAFPAYAVLLGFALWKIQQVKWAGPLLACGAAILLSIPIGMKLFLYFRAPSVSEVDARGTAAALHAHVEDGDGVVFTGLRGLPVIYYLSRLGYRWEDGYCTHRLSGRRFACRMYPRGLERAPAVPPVVITEDIVREDVQAFLRMLRPGQGTLWLVSWRGSVSQGKWLPTYSDGLLARELSRSDLRPVQMEGISGVFLFRRS